MSREKLIEEMSKDICHLPCKCEDCTYPKYRKRIEKCRARVYSERAYNAGYRKQKEGEWIAKDNFDGRCSIATCSNCGTEKAFAVLVKTTTIATLYPYCQKCGAKMKGGAE